MSLLMIHKAYMPVYSDPDFFCTQTGWTGRDGTDQPKVVQEFLADLKTKLENTKYIVKVKVPVNARENFV